MEKDIVLCEELKDFITKAINEALDAREKAKHEVLIPRATAAKLLHKDVSTLNRWEKRSYLIPVRLGKSVMYRSGDLAQLGVVIE